MAAAGIIPVFNHDDITVCIKVVKACYDAGLRVFEFTNRGAGAREVFIKLKAYVETNLEGFLLGAGTVMNGDDANFYLDQDAPFIVAPFLDLEVGKIARDRNITWIPGCGTLTEIINARKAGADIIKVFPGSTLGPSFVSSVLGPVPDLKLMPTGGVNPVEKDLKEWFDAGVVCVGMGSQLFSKSLINEGDFAELTKQIAAAKGLVEKIRKK
jgi:2-dehydro-3-deoxyphosphogluconate aldolase/(4S)-4-hydroxy-2-oxoglutarate aldolase